MSGLGANVQATQAVISLRSYVNPVGPTAQSILNWSTPDAFTADASAVLAVTVGTSTTTSFDLATLFAAYGAPLFVSITDVSNPGIGFTIAFDSSGNTLGVGPNSWLAWTADGTTALPTVWITNPSGTQELVISLGVLSN
jgi:hypothetical protein